MPALVLTLIAALGICGPVIISEVQYDAPGTDSPNEFVELTNISAGAVNLSGWQIADIFSTDDLTGNDTLLAAGAVAIIFEGDYDVINGIYADLVPEATLIRAVGNLAIGNGLHNSADSLYLINARGDTVDRMGWETGPPEAGYTLEKAFLDDCSPASPWRYSQALLGTPGSQNSASWATVDLALVSLSFSDGAESADFTLEYLVENAGLSPSSGDVRVGGETVAQLDTLAPGDSVAGNFVWTPPGDYLGLIPVTAVVAAADDYNAQNDSVMIELPIAAPAGALVINEIMYAPLTGEPEWVELLSRTPRTIQLKQWRFADAGGDVALPAYELGPAEYLVVMGDTAAISDWPASVPVLYTPGLPTLNNSGDAVAVRDVTGNLIDEVDYTFFVQPPNGRSLERVHPDSLSQSAASWVASPAVKGHTAGAANAARPSAPEEASIRLNPNPLRINTPSARLHLEYVTPFATATLVVEIYDLAGRRLATIMNGGPLPGAGELEWDADELDVIRFRTGQYVLHFKATDLGSSRTWERVKRLILVAG